MDTSTFRVLFIICTAVVGRLQASNADNSGDVQQLEAQRRQSPINFGIRIIDEISDSVSQSIQGLLGVTQPGRPQRMPRTPSRFVHFNPASAFPAQTPPPPLPQTSQFPQFPTPHPALASTPTFASVTSGHSLQSPPLTGLGVAHPAGTQPNFASQGHFNIPGPVQANSVGVPFGVNSNAFVQQNLANPTQFTHPSGPQFQSNSVSNAQVVSSNSIQPQQSSQLSQNPVFNPNFQATFSTKKPSPHSLVSHGSGKSQNSVQQSGNNWIASTASLSNVASTNVGAQVFTEVPFTIPDSFLQLQPPNVETQAPGFGFQNLAVIQTTTDPLTGSATPQVNQQFGENILSAHSGNISPESLRGEFSTFTNAQNPGLVLKIPNSMLLEKAAKDKLAELSTGPAGKAIIQTSDPSLEHHNHHPQHTHSHSKEHSRTNDDSAGISDQFLSQFLSTATRTEGSIIPTEAVIHMSAGNSHGDTESLSFKEMPKKKLKQKLHFGGWVGVQQEKTANAASSSNIASTLGFDSSSSPATAQSFTSHQDVNLKPIFLPPTQLIPPHMDTHPTAGALGKNLIKSSHRQPPKHNGIQSFDRPSSQVFPTEKSKLKKQNFSSALDFLQKGSKVQKNFQSNPVNQKIMTILRPHVQEQSLKLISEVDPAVFGIVQTLQPPNREDTFGEFRTNLQNPEEEFLTLTLADESGSDSLEALLLDDSTVALEHDDDTGTLSFTQVIDNANPAQVEQAQQLITAIPAINVSQLLHSDINSTHAYDTELTLKSLLSFRKKPRRIQSFDGQMGFLQEIPNHLSSSVQLNSFVTPPSIEITDFTGLNHFHNKQGLKLSPTLDLQMVIPPVTIPQLNQYAESVKNRSQFISSSDRKKRHETRFNKVNDDSFHTLASQDEVWKVNHQPLPVPRVPSTGMSPPPLPGSLNSFPNAPILGLRAPDQLRVHFQQNSPETISPLVELANFLSINNSQIQTSGTEVLNEYGKQLLLPSVVLQPPLRETSLRITPRPEHQFGAVIHNVPQTNFGTVVETTSVSVPVQSDDQSNQFPTSLPPTFSVIAQGQTRNNEQDTSHQNPLFQGQLANFPTIIVSQHQRPLQPQLPGNSQNPFQNVQFNQVQNPQVTQQQPSSQQNQFRQEGFSSTQNNPPQHTQNSANNVIGTKLISHESGTHGNAFDFLNNPAPLVHQIPVSLVQTPSPRNNNFNQFHHNSNNNHQNIDLKRIITGVGGQFSQNVQAFPKGKSIGGNSITVNESSPIRNIFRKSQRVESEDNSTESNATAEIGFSSSTPQPDSILNQFRQQTFLHRVTPFKTTTISPTLNQLQLPEEERLPNSLQFVAQPSTSPRQVTTRSFISTSTSVPRFLRIGSGIDVKMLTSSVPELTTNTVLDKIEGSPENDELFISSTTVAPWSRRFRGRFMTTTPPSARPALSVDQSLDLNSNTSTTSTTSGPRNPFGLPFTPWPANIEHGRRLTTSTTTQPPSTTPVVVNNPKFEITWPPIRPRVTSSTTTTVQPTVTSTKPPEKSTSASIFETWLRTHQLTPSPQEPTEEPKSGNLSIDEEVPLPRSIETFESRNISQKRRRNFPRIRKRPSSRPGVPEYIAQESKVRPVSVLPLSTTSSSPSQPENNSTDSEPRETELPTTTLIPSMEEEEEEEEKEEEEEEEVVTTPASTTNGTDAAFVKDFSNEDFIFISTKIS